MIFEIRTIFVINILVMCFHLREFRRTDIRKPFSDRKKQHKVGKGFDTKILVKKEYLNGVVHYNISNDNKHIRWKRIFKIEKDFRRLLAMKGVTYDYKRDVSWRTWRTVLNPDGKENIISYKCNSYIHNCKNCIGGVWTIEDKPPPCPYEFYSLVDDNTLCGANYTQYKDIKATCPSKIKFTGLTATCDNPIETTWRFKRVYNHSKKYENIICGGGDFCEIFTTYTITPEHVIFRIINSSKEVIYSRIMKPGNNNFKCIKECGIYNPFNKTVTKNKNSKSLSSRYIKKKSRQIESKISNYVDNIKY